MKKEFIVPSIEVKTFDKILTIDQSVPLTQNQDQAETDLSAKGLVNQVTIKIQD